MSHDLLASITHDESRIIDLSCKHDNKINGYIQPGFPIQDNPVWIRSTLIYLHDSYELFAQPLTSKFVGAWVNLVEFIRWNL